MDPAGKGVRDRRPGFNHWLLTLQVSQNDLVLRFHPSRCRRCGQDRQFTQLPDLGSTTSTAITAALRNSCVRSMASRPNTSTITSDGDEPSKTGGIMPNQPIGCSAQSASRNANKYCELSLHVRPNFLLWHCNRG